MRYRKKIRALAFILFSGLFLLSSAMIISYLGKSRRQEAAFDRLEEMAEGDTSSAEISSDDSGTGEDVSAAMLPGYAALYEKNPDLFGWVRIPDTELSYPVMFTPDDPEYYLRRSFDRSESASGVPFLDGDCRENGGNYLIYGHNMSVGTMFSIILSYADQEFWEEHPVIRFDTLFERGEYEVMAAFYSEVYDTGDMGVFRYYEYADLSDQDRFRDYVTQVEAEALYDTGVTAEYGDQLLTLSTCSYHTDDGRFVVVARKKT